MPPAAGIKEETYENLAFSGSVTESNGNDRTKAVAVMKQAVRLSVIAG